jgi:hypothetical protein
MLVVRAAALARSSLCGGCGGRVGHVTYEIVAALGSPARRGVRRFVVSGSRWWLLSSPSC